MKRMDRRRSEGSTVSWSARVGVGIFLCANDRLAWRVFFGKKALEGRKRFVFAMLTFLGFWALFAAGQVGGSISHP